MRHFLQQHFNNYCRFQHYKNITFVSNVDSLDWKDNATPESICKRVVNKVKNGSIVLFHNDAEHTPEALPNILKTLKEQGYEFVFIEDLIYKENYEIKHDGTQCKISEQIFCSDINLSLGKYIYCNKTKALYSRVCLLLSFFTCKNIIRPLIHLQNKHWYWHDFR